MADQQVVFFLELKVSMAARQGNISHISGIHAHFPAFYFFAHAASKKKK